MAKEVLKTSTKKVWVDGHQSKFERHREYGSLSQTNSEVHHKWDVVQGPGVAWLLLIYYLAQDNAPRSIERSLQHYFFLEEVNSCRTAKVQHDRKVSYTPKQASQLQDCRCWAKPWKILTILTDPARALDSLDEAAIWWIKRLPIINYLRKCVV